MEKKAAIVMLRSTSRNFPLDFRPELEKAGYEVASFEGLDDYIASPARNHPHLAILEIGAITDIERAQIVFEWTEVMHPQVNARFVLLMASKNIALGENSKKFGSAEVSILPQPTRNLLFKIELHQRLLHAQPVAPKTKAEGFSVSAAVETIGGGSQRILIMRGQDEKAGQWKDFGLSPTGKVRWRWVRRPDAPTSGVGEGYAWVAEGKIAPTYSEQKQAWVMDGKEDDVVCLYKEKEIYSARKALDPTVKKNTAAGAAPVSSVELSTLVSKPGEPTPIREKAAPPRAPEAPVEKKVFSSGAAAPPEQAPVVSPVGSERDGGSAISGATAGGSSSEKTPSTIFREALRESKAAPTWTVHDTSAPPPAGIVHDKRSTVPDPSEDARSLRKNAAAAPGAEVNKVEKAPKETTVPPVTSRLGSEAPVAEGAPQTMRKETSGAPTPAVEIAGAAPPAPASTEKKVSTEKTGAAASTVAASASEKAAKNVVEHGSEGLPAEKTTTTLGGKAEQEAKPVKEVSQRPTGEEVPLAKEEMESYQSAQNPINIVRPATADLEVSRRTRQGSEESFSTVAERKELAADQVIGLQKSRAEEEAAVALPAREQAELKVELRDHSAKEPIGQSEVRVAAAKEAVASETRLAPDQPTEKDSRAFLKERHYVIVGLAELGDQQSTWHPAGERRIYLSAQQRYFGIKDPAEVLPLWVYEGELAPEFIDEMKAWKFYDRPPVKITSLDSLPADVLVQVYQLSGRANPLVEQEAEMAAGAAAQKAGAGGEQQAQAPGEGRDFYSAEAKKKGGAWSKIVSTIKGILGK